MAIPTVTVQGKVLGPNGTAERGLVKLLLQCPPNTTPTVDDGATTHFIALRLHTDIGTDGTVGVDLIPNDQISPSGTYYWVIYETSDAIWSERWSVASTPDPVDIGDIPRL